MISLIVCSINDDLFLKFSESVSASIGTEFEIIRIDNNIEKLGICAAYNKGAVNSKFDIFVFVHEDVTFLTNNWGTVLLDYFESLPNPGVLGIGGSSYKTIAPSSWWNSIVTRQHINILQQFKSSGLKAEHQAVNSGSYSRVFGLDGVFLAIKKNVFNEFRFDEDLQGFHVYDLSLSLRVSLKYINYFVPHILIEHLSQGKPDNKWVENTYLVHKKLIKYLPLSADGKIYKKVEYETMFTFFREITDSRLSFRRKNKLIILSARLVCSKLNVFVLFYLICKTYVRWGIVKPIRSAKRTASHNTFL